MCFKCDELELPVNISEAKLYFLTIGKSEILVKLDKKSPRAFMLNELVKKGSRCRRKF